jgi:hypothetical protein
MHVIILYFDHLSDKGILHSLQTVAFVFKDLIVSRANETHWLKLQPPSDQLPAMGWRTAHYSSTLPFGITNRLEHSAILDRFGSMYVWGGRFQR